MPNDVPALRRSWPAVAGESIRVAMATRIVSLLVVIVALLIPGTALGATGLNIEGQMAILRRVDEVGARTITVLSTGEQPSIPASSVERVGRLSGVGWAVGLGPVFDARSRGPGGQPTPVRAYRAVGAPVVFGTNQGPPAGAYVSAASASRLGMKGAYGILDPGRIPVAGWFVADEPLESLEAFVLVPTDDDRLRLERIVIAVDDVAWVDLLVERLPAVLGAEAAQTALVQRSPALLEARAAVREEVNRRDRQLMLAILTVGIALAAVVVSSGTIGARRDFGRRRALGATRPQLTVLVILATLWPALAGAAIGTIIGWLYLASRLGHAPDWRYPVAVGLLTVIVIVTASAVPAAAAATRDPLQVLRIP